MCPLPEKAIRLEEREAQGTGGSESGGQESGGEPYMIQVPIVQHDRCIGCGLCENKCPVNGEAAIRVRVDPMA